MKPQSPETPSQMARDFAADLHEILNPIQFVVRNAIRNGRQNNHKLVQTFHQFEADIRADQIERDAETLHDLEKLYERLKEGSYFEEYDEALRLLGVLRKHIAAIRAQHTQPHAEPDGERTNLYRKTSLTKAIQISTEIEARAAPGICTGGPSCKSKGAPEDAWPHIHTLEGDHTWTPGDWLMTGPKGENYFCKPDIFAATYEPAAGINPTTETPKADDVDRAAAALEPLLFDPDPHVRHQAASPIQVVYAQERVREKARAVIEALASTPDRGRVAELEAAAKPLADMADRYDGLPPPKFYGDTDFTLNYHSGHPVSVTLGQLRALRVALAKDQGAADGGEDRG